jgi:hypothetical protein
MTCLHNKSKFITEVIEHINITQLHKVNQMKLYT